jgi:hypothetical protein
MSSPRCVAKPRTGTGTFAFGGLPDEEHTIVDESFDEFFGDDPAFYTNIHPNSRCLGLIAGWEVDTIRGIVGNKLPYTP